MAINSQFRKSESIVAAWPRTMVLALLMAGWIVATWADRAASQAVVNGLMVTTVDTPLTYTAIGPVNTSHAWTDNSPPPVVGPWYGVPGLVPAPAGGAHWEFSVRHSATQFKSKQASSARLYVKGKHIRVPAPGHNEGPNALPEIGTEAIDVPLGKPASVSTWGALPHLGADPPHHDLYGVKGTLNYSVLGATGTLGGQVEVGAVHTDCDPTKFKSWRIGSSLVSSGLRGNPDGSTVSFNAETGRLSFAPGRIDVLDLQGGLSGYVDPRYANDPILNAHLSVSDMTLQGRQQDGRFLFSGGSLSIADQFGQIGMHASFDDYTIGDTSLQDALDSFGVLSSGKTIEQYEASNAGMLSFLDDFTDDHLLRQLPTSRGFSARVMDLAFITHSGMDLATLTNGFTTSALYVPADIYVGGNGFDVPPDDGSGPGDYNGDTVVDSRDYAVWRSDFGMTDSPADGNGNGIVDTADYALWRDNVGAILNIAGAASLASQPIAVPEPSIAALAMIGLCLTMSGRRIRWAADSKVNDRSRNTWRLAALRLLAGSFVMSRRS